MLLLLLNARVIHAERIHTFKFKLFLYNNYATILLNFYIHNVQVANDLS
jgi:hypothetical protein